MGVTVLQLTIRHTHGEGMFVVIIVIEKTRPACRSAGWTRREPSLKCVIIMSRVGSLLSQAVVLMQSVLR